MNRVYFLLVVLFSISLSAQDESNPCIKAQSYHIFVLGSSTAAGTGPSSSDSTWVNRYRKFLQSINPNNQVSNLAVGGTTTYHIMPDWFNPPPFRPSPSNNNITAAIQQGADAIIVNMPSNDASNNFGLNEQMTNFTTIAAVADSFNIPIWVCTTQPKNYASASKIQIQLDVRDSILNYFGDRAIDFWTTIANNTNTIDSLYDSGDGTHLNDAAHRLLMSRVRSENILSNLYDTLSFPDFAIADYYIENPSLCGDSLTVIKTLVTNLGSASSSTVYIQHMIWDYNLAMVSFISDSIVGGISSCEMDTFRISIPTHLGSDLRMRSWFHNSSDSIKQNDSTDFLYYKTTGLPRVTNFRFPDTICGGDSVVFEVFANNYDTILWYDSKQSVNPIGGGTFLSKYNISSTDSIYAQAIKGPLHFRESLFTTSNSNVNWNGIMFNLVAHDSITIDSLALKLFSSGHQGIQAYYYNGSYKSVSSNNMAWTNWGIDSIYNAASGEFYNVSFTPLNLFPGDTLGIYLHLQNPSSQLSYENNGGETSAMSSELEIISGSGITYTFGTPYFPRYWNGEIFYHHGYNPNGDCASDRIPVPFYANEPSVDLGPDQSIKLSQNLILDAGAGFVNYSWLITVNGNTSSFPANQFLPIQSIVFNNAIAEIVVVVEDSMGCLASDSVTINVTDDIGLPKGHKVQFEYYPNPSRQQLTVQSMVSGKLQIISSSGVLLTTYQIDGAPASQDLQLDLRGGVYILNFHYEGGQITRKLIVEDF